MSDPNLVAYVTLFQDAHTGLVATEHTRVLRCTTVLGLPFAIAHGFGEARRVVESTEVHASFEMVLAHETRADAAKKQAVVERLIWTRLRHANADAFKELIDRGVCPPVCLITWSSQGDIQYACDLTFGEAKWGGTIWGSADDPAFRDDVFEAEVGDRFYTFEESLVTCPWCGLKGESNDAAKA